MHYREKRRERNLKGEGRQREKGICEREKKEKRAQERRIGIVREDKGETKWRETQMTRV